MAYTSDKIEQVYGFSGKKGSGKDTLAKMVLENNPKFKILHFADRLKEICSVVFNINSDYFHVPEMKEVPFEKPIFIDDYIFSLRRETGLELEKRGLIANNPRELLQFVGTDYVRSVCDSYWVDYIINIIKRTPKINKKYIVADVRFKNEADAIKAINGNILMVRREGLDSADSHKSETEMSQINPDFLVFFKNGNFDLHKRLAGVISSNRTKFIHKFDWRKFEPALEQFNSGAISYSDLCERLGYTRGTASSNATIIRNMLNYYGSHRANSLKTARRKEHKIIGGVDHKHCSDCDTYLPTANFNKSFRSYDRLNSICRICAGSRNKLSKSKIKDIVHDCYKKSEKSARHRKKEWGISFDYYKKLIEKQRGRCFYTGNELSFVSEKGNNNRVTIDRVDPKLGYTEDNVVLCTRAVNAMKQDLTFDVFCEMVELIYFKHCAS